MTVWDATAVWRALARAGRRTFHLVQRLPLDLGNDAPGLASAFARPTHFGVTTHELAHPVRGDGVPAVGVRITQDILIRDS